MEQFDHIKITATGTSELKDVWAGLEKLPADTLAQIESAEKTLLGITCTFGKPNRDGYYNIPRECTHVYQHQGNTHFSMPNHCLILTEDKEVKFILGK